MKAVVSKWGTYLSAKGRAEIDNKRNDVYKNFDQLVLAEKDGARGAHQQICGVDIYVEVMKEDGNVEGAYMGMSGETDATISTEEEVLVEAFRELIKNLWAGPRKAENRKVAS